MLISATVQADVRSRLDAAEREHGVRILYACESGSRAWGFASPDSDYDVRFLYVRPAQWYLSIDVEYRRDVIEYPILDEIDINGWDLRKALQLFRRSNGALLEWLQSPIVYRREGTVAADVWALAQAGHNPLALIHHYRSMAKSQGVAALAGDRVKLKKYLYALRSVLAVRYLEAGRGVPPIRFQDLLDAVAPAPVKAAAEDLVARKARTPELGLGEPIPVLGDFIRGELARLEVDLAGTRRPDLGERAEIYERLNEIFRDAVAGERR